MNIEDLITSLSEDFLGYFQVREKEPPSNLLDKFIIMATERIDCLVEGGYSPEEAYEQYKSELPDDIDYTIKRYENEI